ncbi:hypothetical protein [Rothia nasimurium]|uniref:hypothetical protein n=1 Tax=Rothia nasimurium TaxID=85336 RepID=UPI001F30BA08|nr:hypothetical protein [Rothia nasimurium]
MKNKASFLSIATAVTLMFTGCVTINRASDEPSPQVTTVVVAPETSSPAPAEASSAEATQDTATATAQTQAPQPAAPEGVAPGTSCGPSNTGASTLVVAENAANVNCDQVQSIFADFNTAFANGRATHHQIQGFACHTRSPEDVSEEGRSVTCTQGGTRLEAMTFYPLGGIPVEDASSYKSSKYPYPYHIFRTGFADCEMGGFEGYAISCTGNSNGQPVQVTVSQSGFIGQPVQTIGSYDKVLDSLPPSNGGKYLPAGEVFAAYEGACLNNGDSVTCTYKGRSFTLSPTGYTLN